MDGIEGAGAEGRMVGRREVREEEPEEQES